MSLNDPVCSLLVELGFLVCAFTRLINLPGGGGVASGNSCGIIGVTVGILGRHHPPQPNAWLRGPWTVKWRLL